MDQHIIRTEEAKKSPISELVKKLSSTEKGLSASEAKERLQHCRLRALHGPDRLELGPGGVGLRHSVGSV
jgi:hypothetical protein